MKRRITLSIALALSVMLLSLASSDSTTKAQGNRFYRFDTGVVALGPNQTLRVTVNLGAGNDNFNVRFRRQTFRNGGSYPNGVALLTLNDEHQSPLMTLAPNEGASLDVMAEWGRAEVLTNKPNVRVNAQNIDTDTGRVVATFTAGQDARMDAQ